MTRPEKPPSGSSRAPARWIDAMREVLRIRRYSTRTADAYVGWLRRFIGFRARLPAGTTDEEALRSFLSHLASSRGVGSSSQRQAHSAIRFAYQAVGTHMPWLRRVHAGVSAAEVARRVVARRGGVGAGMPGRFQTIDRDVALRFGPEVARGVDVAGEGPGLCAEDDRGAGREG